MSPPGRRADRWRRLSKTFWLLPAAMCVLGAVLAEVLILLDQRLGDLEFGPFRMLVTRVGAAGSGDLLGAIAGSMLTVASTTFSITIPALALASSTYGPRLVRNFTADRGNQFVLGVFLATFLYSLLVLRSIRVLDEGGEQTFVPHLAVNVAVLLAVSALGVLVYFIHHIADSIQVWTLAQQGRTDLLTVVERLSRSGWARTRARTRTTPVPGTVRTAPVCLCRRPTPATCRASTTSPCSLWPPSTTWWWSCG